MSQARIDAGSPPRVSFPTPYNAAADLLSRHLATKAAKVAFRDDEGQLTYGGLSERADRAGRALLALGLEPEQRVVLAMQDTVDFPCVFLGAMKAGLVPVPVNTLLTPDDFAYLLADSRARALVVSEALYPRLEAAAASVRQVVLSRSPGGQGAAAPGRLRLDELLARARPGLAAAPTTADDVAFWLYSSGSTGRPKGAMHLHSHLLETAALYAQGVLGLTERDVVFSAAKLFFAYGLGNSLTFPLAVGATAVLLAERPTPPAVLRVLEQHQPTVFCGVPTLFASLLAALEAQPREGSKALRCSVSAGEALPRHVGEKWRRASAPTSTTASAPPSCCTSSCPTGPATCATGRRGARCRATSQAGGRRRRAGRRRRGGRAVGARPERRGGLLEPAGEEPGHLPRPVDAHRRPLRPRRGGPVHVLRARRRHAEGGGHLGLALRGGVGAGRA